MITLTQITKKYGDTTILENAGYVFPPQGLVCLIGPSGGGKTTLLNLIAGFDTGYEGEISVGGQSITAMDAAALCEYRCRQVGFVFQNYHLLTGYSVLENILLAAQLSDADHDESRKKAESLLKALGIADKKNQQIENLSGGQKQRVAIARALLGNPQVILADEPTGALDRKTSSEIMALLKTISKEKLVVVITHDPKLLEYADEVIHIEEKKIVSNCSENRAPYPPSPSCAAYAGKKASSKKQAVNNVKIHLKRYLAVALAISMGMLAFLFSLSFGNVMEQSIDAFQQKNTAFNNGYIKGADDGSVLSALQTDERIENVYYQYKLDEVTLSIGEHTEIMPEKVPMPKAGEALSYGAMPRRGANEIAITPSLAKKYAADIQTLIGEKLNLTYNDQEYNLTVSGIYNAGYDDFFVSSDVEQTLYEGIAEQENYSISYDVKLFDDIVSVSNSLKLKEIESKSAVNEVFALQETFRSLNKLFFVISALIMLIALLICCLLLWKLQNTRYKEIGLLSALGFHRSYISRMIQTENLLLSILTAAINGIMLLGAIPICRMVQFPLLLSEAQFFISTAASFALVMIISATASYKLTHTEPAAALRA